MKGTGSLMITYTKFITTSHELFNLNTFCVMPSCHKAGQFRDDSSLNNNNCVNCVCHSSPASLKEAGHSLNEFRMTGNVSECIDSGADSSICRWWKLTNSVFRFYKEINSRASVAIKFLKATFRRLPHETRTQFWIIVLFYCGKVPQATKIGLPSAFWKRLAELSVKILW